MLANPSVYATYIVATSHGPTQALLLRLPARRSLSTTRLLAGHVNWDVETDVRASPASR